MAIDSSDPLAWSRLKCIDITRLAKYMGVSDADLSQILGVDTSAIGMIRDYMYPLHDHPEAQLKSNLFTTSGALLWLVNDESGVRAWLRNAHVSLEGVPIELMRNAEGATKVSDYLRYSSSMY